MSNKDVPQPDLLVVRSIHADRIGEDVVEGPPDVVIEILSPGTAGRDLIVKRELYARSGILEYWIIDPVNSEIEVLVLQDDLYSTFARYARTDTLASPALPGLAIPLEHVLD